MLSVAIAISTTNTWPYRHKVKACPVATFNQLHYSEVFALGDFFEIHWKEQ
jgi:hypothetical protein